MNTLKQKNLESLIFKTFDKEIEGTDIYNHNGSMWIIFIDEKKWVVEYTKDQTLWYNYSLFNNMMMLFGMDDNETAEYVKTWFENRFLFKPKVEEINHVDVMKFFNNKMDDTIQNGVKHAVTAYFEQSNIVEDTIQNGVKDAYVVEGQRQLPVEDTIQNGVKNTNSHSMKSSWRVEDTIQNGVRMTKSTIISQDYRVEDTIQNGVKHSEDGDWLDGDERIENIIQNGVKQ